MKLKLLTLFLAIVAGVGTIFAFDAEIGGLYYNLNSSKKTATVTYKSYAESFPHYYNQDWDITEVTIPAKVTYNGEKYRVTSIGKNAFRDCRSLKTVTMSNSVKSIGEYAFTDCRNLVSVTLGNRVKSIKSGTFSGCSSLTSVNIPNGVKTIGYRAFHYCSSLTSVTIPHSVTGIEYSAFEDCKSLTKVTISDIASWCNIDFKDNHANPLTIAQHLYINDEEITELVIPDSVKIIRAYAFQGCTNIISVIIPDSVTKIGGGAFSGCSGLTAINIPNSVTEIMNGSFSHCSGLTSVVIPENVTYVGYAAFAHCDKLDSVTWNAKSAKTESVVFGHSSSTGFKDLYFGVPVKSFVIGDNVEKIPPYLCVSLTELQSITFPQKLREVGDSAFEGCKGLTHISAFPSSITRIGNRAFFECSSLESIKIANDKISIGSFTFDNCDNLQAIFIPESSLENYQKAYTWSKYSSLFKTYPSTDK